MLTTKDHIVSEIRRTAAENGGRPLGQSRFFSETGIKVSYWRGRYWARWGDALQEAGFRPNILNAARESDVMLEHLARLVRELGHYPVEAEIRLKRRADPVFPSQEAFRRFGGK